ncbi:protein phosphatase 2C domain-containing protein [Nostoc sp.]|uniref:protein phosphatase 2C domain-containing protein n=1 Tax=Nostoc sp. TaxID=1180 RepID=UPI003FA5F48B
MTAWKKWRRVFDAVVGSSHLRVDPPIPCQDSALSVLISRPAIFVADGAGSARLSHFGSSAVVRYLIVLQHL